ncbi:MAG: copper-binding protein [Gammaproteobacteria bacterium]|nr:copper-binding protein [Gammaproteobacteria bacterium]
MRYKRVMLTIAIVTSAAMLPQFSTAEEKHHPATPQTPAQEETLSDGEIRKVDKDAKKITIRHGPIVNLDMPNMTMVFQVKDPALLEQVKAGDRVKFVADKIGGAYVVTRIEPAK